MTREYDDDVLDVVADDLGIERGEPSLLRSIVGAVVCGAVAGLAFYAGTLPAYKVAGEVPAIAAGIAVMLAADRVALPARVEDRLVKTPAERHRTPPYARTWKPWSGLYDE